MPVTVRTAWAHLGTTRIGRWIFGRIICFKAPYFKTIRPKFLKLESGFCQIEVAKRRSVLNHVGTVHAIAMCNAAELAAGLATEMTLPKSHRWIPKAMSVQYLKPAKSNITAVARLAPLDTLGTADTINVGVDVTDASGISVFHAEISMHISERRANKGIAALNM